MSSKGSKIIFGFRAVIETMLAGKTIEKVFIQKGHKLFDSKEFYDYLNYYKVPYSYVPPQKLKSITAGNHQGVVALLSPIDFVPLETIIQTTFEKGKNPLVVILDGITDVHNFGAIARTALCMGVDVLVIPMRGAACLSGAAMKTSAGALATLPICRVSHLDVAIQYLQESGLMVVACYEAAAEPLYEVDLKLPTAFILGSEGEGIGLKNLQLVTHHINIPMQGPITSLNVSVAAGVILYEAFRQRMEL